jgi:hypothetical protein
VEAIYSSISEQIKNKPIGKIVLNGSISKNI